MEVRKDLINSIIAQINDLTPEERKEVLTLTHRNHPDDFKPDNFMYIGERFNYLPYDKKRIPIMTVSRKGSFEAAHNNITVGGKCARLHGHRYEYEVFVRGPVNPDTGIVVDFREIKEVMKKYVEDRLDHQYLNEVLPFVTSAEHVCIWIYQTLKSVIPEVYKVVLWEVEKSRVEVCDDDFI